MCYYLNRVIMVVLNKGVLILKWVLLIVLILVVLCLLLANFLLNATFLKDNKWYDKIGHKMMNPDNFSKTKSKYDIIEENQKNLGYEFWDTGDYEDIYLGTERGNLYARQFLHPHSNKWAILVHGYRKTGKEDMSFYALNFYSKGFNVLVPDLYAHGKSDGNDIGMGWRDRLDICLWIDELVKQNPQSEIILFGGSMGASTIMMASGEKLPNQVKGLIADCGYSSVYDEFSYLVKSLAKLPDFPIVTTLNQLAKVKLGASLKEMSAVSQLKNNQLPALFIHGNSDKFVPHEMIYKNVEATQGVKESLIVEKAPHLSSAIYEEENYFETVFEFITRYCIQN